MVAPGKGRVTLSPLRAFVGRGYLSLMVVDLRSTTMTDGRLSSAQGIAAKTVNRGAFRFLGAVERRCYPLMPEATLLAMK